MMKTLGETDYSKEVRKSLKTIEKDGLKGTAKAKEIAKGVVRGTKSNVISEAEEAFNTKTLKNVIKATKKSGRITKGVKTAFKESNVGTALKTGSKFANGVAVLFVSNRIDKSINLTNEIKTKANSFIKGCGDFVKGMKGWKQWT